jgi:hypothetical protein
MQALKLIVVAAFTVALGFVLMHSSRIVSSQVRQTDGNDRFMPKGSIETERQSAPAGLAAQASFAPTEAPAGFDNRTNGYLPQGPAFNTIEDDNVVPGRSFNDNRFIFEETEVVADGLGPTYNAQSCRECHQNVVTGGASQIPEHRTGHMLNGAFF